MLPQPTRSSGAARRSTCIGPAPVSVSATARNAAGTASRAPGDRTRGHREWTLADIDQPGVKIGVNPGGTNEKFVLANIKQAEIVVIEKNLDIPGKIAASEVDVMITDNVEAMLVAGKRPELYAVSPENTFTKDDFGYMLPRDEFTFLNWLNLWIHQMHEKGEFEQLKAKWIAE